MGFSLPGKPDSVGKNTRTNFRVLLKAVWDGEREELGWQNQGEGGGRNRKGFSGSNFGTDEGICQKTLDSLMSELHVLVGIESGKECRAVCTAFPKETASPFQSCCCWKQIAPRNALGSTICQIILYLFCSELTPC